eukprot:350578-Pyramimonas_sp.AAC.1
MIIGRGMRGTRNCMGMGGHHRGSSSCGARASTRCLPGCSRSGRRTTASSGHTGTIGASQTRIATFFKDEWKDDEDGITGRGIRRMRNIIGWRMFSRGAGGR